MPLEKSAGAVIFRYHVPHFPKRRQHHAFPKASGAHREYLLLHYEAGHWDFPKGHLEGSERPEDAARREIREETGLSIRQFIPGFRRHVRYWLWKYPDREDGKSRRSLKIVTFFLAESPSSDVRLSWEHTGYVWLPYRAAVRLLTYENAKDLLRRAEAFLRVYPKGAARSASR